MTLETAIVRTRVRRQGPGGLPARETGGRVLVAAVAASPLSRDITEREEID